MKSGCYALANIGEVAKELLLSYPEVRLFAFYGEMGAGKTTLIQAICVALGVMEPVTSPTFTLVNEYEGYGGAVYHFDFYRLDENTAKAEVQAREIGLDEYLYSGNYCLMEWPERVEGLLPEGVIKIGITPGETLQERCMHITN